MVRDALLEIRELRRRFGEFDVFGSLTFDLGYGQALCLAGPNGSGKTTALRCIAGIDSPTAGSVHCDGLPVDERSASTRSDLAIVIDDLDFFPDLSVVEHLDLLARAHRVDEPENVVAQTLDDVGLTRQSSQLPGTLSSGQRRRLTLATAFVRPRRLLILDEPEQRLDRDGFAWLIEQLNTEKQHGLAILLASHSPELIDAVADSVIDLDANR